MPRRTDAEYDALADEYASAAPTPAGPITVYPERLSAGRPPKDKARGVNTPAISIRFPPELRERLDGRADADKAPVAEVVRRAVVEYLERHPA